MAGRDIMMWTRRIVGTLALAYALLLAGCSAVQAPKQGVFLLGAGHNDLLRHGSAEVALEFLGRLFEE